MPLHLLAWTDVALPGGVADSPDARSVTLVGALRELVLQRVKAFQDAGINVDAVQSDCLALQNWFAFDGDRPGASGAGAATTILLDVGSETTNFVAILPERLWFRSFHFGAETLKSHLVRELKISLADAERLHCDPTAMGNSGAVYDAMSTVFDDLLKQLQSSLAALRRDRQALSNLRILGLGGGFLLHGLFRHLRNGR